MRMREHDDEVFVEILGSLIGLSMLPLKVSACVVSDVAKAVEKAIPEPDEIKAGICAAELNALRALRDMIDRRIEEIEKSASEERKEKVKVE